MLEASTENLLHQLKEVYEQLDTAVFQWYVKYRFRNLCLVSKHYKFTKTQSELYSDLVNRYKKRFVYDEWDYDPESSTDSLLVNEK